MSEANEKAFRARIKSFNLGENPCAGQNQGPCFDWTSMEGVRTLCYCGGADKKCSDCVQKKV